jgi:hypothetical protein
MKRVMVVTVMLIAVAAALAQPHKPGRVNPKACDCGTICTDQQCGLSTCLGKQNWMWYVAGIRSARDKT